MQRELTIRLFIRDGRIHTGGKVGPRDPEEGEYKKMLKDQEKNQNEKWKKKKKTGKMLLSKK